MRIDGPGVWRIDGVPRRITALPSAEFANQWTMMSDDVAYVQDAQGKDRKLLAQAMQGGPPRVPAFVPHYAETKGFSIDRTGTVIDSAA